MNHTRFYSVDPDVAVTIVKYPQDPDREFDIIVYDRHPYIRHYAETHVDVRSVVTALGSRWVGWAHSDATPWRNMTHLVHATVGLHSPEGKRLLDFLSRDPFVAS